MAIEFRCTQCQRLLRTQDDAAGKQAKCPECGTILVVPAPEAGPADIPPPPPPAGAGSGSPFGPPQGTSSPFETQPPPRSSSQNPYQSPTDYMPGPVFAGSTGPITPTQLDFGDIFSRTWTILKNQYGITLGICVVVWLLQMAISFATGMGSAILEGARVDPAILGGFSFLANLAYMLFSTWVGIGAALCYLRISRGQPASVGEVFSGGPYFLRVLVASILFGLILMGVIMVTFLPGMAIGWLIAATAEGSTKVAMAVVAGSLVAIIPVSITALGLSQFYYLLLDQNVGITESLSLSWKITSGNRLMLLAIWTVATIVGAVVTLLTCGLGGLFLAAPFYSLMMPVIYLAMTGQPTADRLYQPPQTI